MATHKLIPTVSRNALLRNASQRGLRAFSHVALLSADEKTNCVRVQTSQGGISPRSVVFATGYDSNRYLENPPGSLHSTFAVVSEPIAEFRGWPDSSLVWETSRPYFYARQTADGRAMIGGEDTAFSPTMSATVSSSEGCPVEKAISKSCFRRFRSSRPTPGRARSARAKTDWLTSAGHENRPNVFFAVGYGGNGITFSMIAAKLIVDLYFDRPNPDADVFKFSR